MTDKTWTATDLRLGKLTIHNGEGIVRVERRYKFADGDGDVLEQIAGGRIVLEVDWSDIPTGIQDALRAINTWTKNKALVQEGMD